MGVARWLGISVVSAIAVLLSFLALAPTRMTLSGTEVERLALAWVDAHTDGLSLKLTIPDDEPGFQSLDGHAGGNLHFESHANGHHWNMNMGFKPALTADSQLEDAAAYLSWVALDRVPLKGFAVPPHWEVYPMTSVSSFKDGVSVEAFGAGRISVRITTSFAFIYGRRTDIQVPAGAGYPAGTYFQLAHPIPATIDLDMPIKI